MTDDSVARAAEFISEVDAGQWRDQQTIDATKHAVVIPDEAVQAAARALNPGPWWDYYPSNAIEAQRRVWLDLARRALTAAVPYL